MYEFLDCLDVEYLFDCGVSFELDLPELPVMDIPAIRDAIADYYAE